MPLLYPLTSAPKPGIKNILTMTSPGFQLCSPVLYSADGIEAYAKVTFTQNKLYIDSMRNLEVKVVFTGPKNQKNMVCFEVTIRRRDPARSKHYISTPWNLRGSELSKCDWGDGISLDYIILPKKMCKDLQMNEDSVTLTFKMWTFPWSPDRNPGLDLRFTEVSTPWVLAETREDAGTSSLVEDLRQLLRSGEGSDLYLVVVGEKHAVHSSILIARSDVFKRMVQSDMLEKQTRMILLEGLTAKVGEAFIEALYTGDVHRDVWSDFGALHELAIAFDVYGVRALASRCVFRIGQLLETENACDVLLFSKAHDFARVLLQVALDFIVTSLEKVRETSSYQKMVRERPQLLDEILANICPRQKKWNPREDNGVHDVQHLVSDLGQEGAS